MSSGCGEGVLAHLVQRGEHLPGDVALQTADDLLLGLALLETPRHVVLGLLVVAQPHQHDPVQRGVGLAVTAAVEPVAGGLAGGRLDRGGAAQHREAGVAAEPAGVVAGGDQQRAGAVLADPEQRHQPGRRRTGEPVQLGGERGDLGRQGLVAAGEDAQREHGRGQVIGPGSSSAAARTSQVTDRPRSCSRSSAGAVTSSAGSALMVWVRARIAVWRPTRSERIISTWPSPALGTTVTWPACTALAAAWASSGSDLPWRRRAARSGRLTSSTTWPSAWRKRARAAP